MELKTKLASAIANEIRRIQIECVVALNNNVNNDRSVIEECGFFYSGFNLEQNFDKLQ